MRAEGGADAENAQRIARRQLSAKLRPLLLRRLKKHVAKDLPDRIEERRDCPLGEEQRKLYSPNCVAVAIRSCRPSPNRGSIRARCVLAALTRLRQVCCHPPTRGERFSERQDGDVI